MFGLWTGGQGQRLDTSDALSALRAQKPQPHGLAPVGGGPAGERGVQLEACGVRGGWKPTRRSVMGAVTTVPPHLQVLGGGGACITNQETATCVKRGGVAPQWDWETDAELSLARF